MSSEANFLVSKLLQQYLKQYFLIIKSMSKANYKSRLQTGKKTSISGQYASLNQKKSETTDMQENLRNINEFMKKFNEMMSSKNSEGSRQINDRILSLQAIFQSQERKRPQVSGKIKQKTQPCYQNSNNNQFSYQNLTTEIDQNQIDHIENDQIDIIEPNATLNPKDAILRQISLSKNSKHKNKLSTVMQESVSELLTTSRENYSYMNAGNSQMNPYIINQNQQRVVCIQPIEIFQGQSQFQSRQVFDLKITKIERSARQKRRRSNSFTKIQSMKQAMKRQYFKQQLSNGDISQNSAQLVQTKATKIKSKLKMNTGKEIIYHSPKKIDQTQFFGFLPLKQQQIGKKQQNTIGINSLIIKKYNSDNSYVELQDNQPNRSKSRKRIFLKQCVCKRIGDTNRNVQAETNQSLQSLRNKSQQGRRRKTGISLTKKKNSLVDIHINKVVCQQSQQKIHYLRPISSQTRKSNERKSQQRSQGSIISSFKIQEAKNNTLSNSLTRKAVNGLKSVASIEIRNRQNVKKQKSKNQIKQDQKIGIKRQRIYQNLRNNIQRANDRNNERTKIKSNKQNLKRAGPRQVKINIDCQNLIASIKNNKTITL